MIEHDFQRVRIKNKREPSLKQLRPKPSNMDSIYMKYLRTTLGCSPFVSVCLRKSASSLRFFLIIDMCKTWFCFLFQA